MALYGSATPRPESWLRLERLSLGSRIGAPMPRVRIVDLRHERGYPLSAPLLRELGKLAEGGGKAILLLNRRGVAPALHCKTCGVTRRCGQCDVALTMHGDERLHCHHCGHSERVPENCPACGSVELARIGAGTQRLETELEKHVPELERVRLDADAAAKPGALRAALDRFAASDRVVLIGTQMVAKGHHFSGVELAAVVDADAGLAMPDFRADERSFQLVTQLAGRSGRDAPGLVLVQTFQPDSLPISHAARHDVAGFLAGELERRRDLGYPPFRHLVSVARLRARGRARDSSSHRAARRSGGRGRRAARAGAAAPPPRSPPRAAPRQDRPAARARIAGRRDARCRLAGDAQGRCDRGRRRRSAVHVTPRSPDRPGARLARGMGEVEGQVVEDDERRDAEDEARRRVALAQIRQYPDPVLRMRANEVVDFDEELARLADRMTTLMHDAHGAGLAANQVGVLRRIFVFTDGDTDHVVVNPGLVERSKSLETDDEGCLSLGPIRVPVERSAEVTLAGQDLTGRRSGWSSTTSRPASSSTSSITSTGC